MKIIPHQTAVLEVGPEKKFTRIEDAYNQASPGDEIRVYPLPNRGSYTRVALRVRKARLTFRAMTGPDRTPVRLEGTGFDYSGQAATPRAIFQFDPGSDGGLLEGFALTEAHNRSHNGAGVRINGASHITIRRCAIFGNDMGVMSGGDGTPGSAADQRIEYCRIYGNGDSTDPGYNHNLYLGGESVLIQFCEIYGSLTGHNLKSRAHCTWVQYCSISEAANREVDLVDSSETERADSHAVLVGNLIVKAVELSGNRGVIHYGQDGGKDHRGTIFLVHNTILTPYLSPVLDLSAPGASALLLGNLLADPGQHPQRPQGQQVVSARNGARLAKVKGSGNLLGSGFSLPSGASFSLAENTILRQKEPLLQDPGHGDYRPRKPFPGIRNQKEVRLPGFPGAPDAPGRLLRWQFQPPADRVERREREVPTVGAFQAVRP